MKALVLEEYKKFQYKAYPTPVPGRNEVLVRVKACAVCGSDVHGMDGSTGRRKPPIIMGHEASGIVEKCGEDVRNYRAGDRVTFDSTIFCGKCEMCLAGNVNLCKNRRVLGVSCNDYRLDGAFAEYVVVPEHVLYLLPENVSFVQAAMIEPLSIAYHAATRTEIKKNAAVMIVGIGTIGLLILQVVKTMGVREIIAVDIDDSRLEIAKQFGATFCVNSQNEDAAEKILAQTKDQNGVDYSFDATGISKTVNFCLQLTALNGAVILVGNLARSIDFPLQWVVTRQQSLFGSCASSGEYEQCLKLIAEGKSNVDFMISKTVPLSEGNEWINRLYNREKGLYKIVLIP